MEGSGSRRGVGGGGHRTYRPQPTVVGGLPEGTRARPTEATTSLPQPRSYRTPRPQLPRSADSVGRRRWSSRVRTAGPVVEQRASASVVETPQAQADTSGCGGFDTLRRCAPFAAQPPERRRWSSSERSECCRDPASRGATSGAARWSSSERQRASSRPRKRKQYGGCGGFDTLRRCAPFAAQPPKRPRWSSSERQRASSRPRKPTSDEVRRFPCGQGVPSSGAMSVAGARLVRAPSCGPSRAGHRSAGRRARTRSRRRGGGSRRRPCQAGRSAS
jgi:hypothetical protein